jgi:hypothetical protein
MQTKIIKLQNGTDLIANVTSIGDVYVLEEPMEFGIESRGNLIMSHYLPVQLIKKNQIEIKEKDVMSLLQPDESFEEYYCNTVEKIKEILNAKNLVNGMSDAELDNIMNAFEGTDQNGFTLH